MKKNKNRDMVNKITKLFKKRFNKHIASYHSDYCSWVTVDDKLVMFTSPHHSNYTQKAALEFNGIITDDHVEGIIDEIYKKCVMRKNVKKSEL